MQRNSSSSSCEKKQFKINKLFNQSWLSSKFIWYSSLNTSILCLQRESLQ